MTLDFSEQIKYAREKMIACYKNGDYAQSLKNGQKLLSMNINGKFTNSMEFADDMFNLALICSEISDYKRAIELYTKSYVAVRHLVGETLEFAARINNLAFCYIKTGGSDIAIGLFKKVAEITEKKLGKNSREHLDSLYNLANAYCESALFAQAIETHTALLDLINEKNLLYADSLNCIGYAYAEQRNYKETKKYLFDAMQIKKQLLDECSDEFIADLLYYAQTLFTLNEYEQAMRIFNRSAKLIKQVYSDKHAYYAKTLNMSAECCELSEQHAKALKLRLKALKLIKTSVGENHMYYSECLRNTASSFEALDDFASAAEYFTLSLDLTKKLIGVRNNLYLRDLSALCIVYIRDNKYEQALSAVGVLIDELAGKNKTEQICEMYNSLVYSLEHKNKSKRKPDNADKINQLYTLIDAIKIFIS